MVASAVFITDLSGKSIISRNYRGDIPLNTAIEHFAKYLHDIPDEQKKPIFYHISQSNEYVTEEDVDIGYYDMSNTTDALTNGNNNGNTMANHNNDGETYVYINVRILIYIDMMLCLCEYSWWCLPEGVPGYVSMCLVFGCVKNVYAKRLFIVRGLCGCMCVCFMSILPRVGTAGEGVGLCCIVI